MQTFTHAHTIERCITLKHLTTNLYRILYALNQDNNEWVKHVNTIVDKYNNTVHSTIEIKPNEAVKPSNHLWVVWHLQNAAKNNRKYKENKKAKWLE